MNQIEIQVPVDPTWHGRSITGEGGRSDTLREAIRTAQRQAMEWIEVSRAKKLTVHWETEDDAGRWHWNPQVNLAAGTTSLYCVAEWEVA